MAQTSVCAICTTSSNESDYGKNMQEPSGRRPPLMVHGNQTVVVSTITCVLPWQEPSGRPEASIGGVDVPFVAVPQLMLWAQVRSGGVGPWPPLARWRCETGSSEKTWPTW